MTKKIVRASALAAIAVTPLVAGISAHSAMADSDASTKVIGGQPVTDPSVVQLAFQQGNSGGTSGCSGELIASQWVLTARHCTEGDTSMDVYFSNSTTDRGTPIKADKFLNSPSGDVGLVHLSSPAPTQKFLTMADAFTPKTGDTLKIEGYGLGANQQPTPSLYGADVSVLGTSTDAFNGQAVHVKGVNGASNHGDSGGPLLSNGQIVGVCSTGDTSDPGANTQATSNYANITGSRSWIKQNAGV